jgi:myo-inositol 2-dehydrogenase/D-chiro-inositol 1-dehydrogenase
VLGEKGMMRVENVHETTVQSATPDGIRSMPYHHSFPERYRQAYLEELDHFIDVMLDPSILLSVTKEQTLLATRIAEACGRSAKEGRMVGLDGK